MVVNLTSLNTAVKINFGILNMRSPG